MQTIKQVTVITLKMVVFTPFLELLKWFAWHFTASQW